jgi:branched-chain amino acid transport system ATP-binding protein
MTVLENLELGGFLQKPLQVQEGIEKMFSQFPVLKERASQNAGTLSGGEQQMLAMARGLMGRPRSPLVDEALPWTFAQDVVGRLGEMIRQINDDGISVLVVEQNTAFVFGQCALRVRDRER